MVHRGPVLKMYSFAWILIGIWLGNFVKTDDINGIEFEFTSAETDPALDPGRVLNITPPEPPTEYPSFITGAVKSLHGSLFNDTFNLILTKGLFFNSKSSRSSSMFELKSPTELQSIINFKLGETGSSHEELLRTIESIVQFSPHVSHPFYLHRNGAGLDPYGIVGDILGTTMSSVLLTFYSAPVFTLMEWKITTKIRELIGYGDTVGDGITAPGPSFANIMALQMALKDKNSQIKISGLVGTASPNYVVYISEDADGAFVKAAILEGLGSKSLIRIRTDTNGRMDVNDLKSKLEAGKASNGGVPLMIVATAGTPILGAIDPIDEIAAVAKANGIWFHIDGTMSGALLLSTSHKDQLKGADKSDSFTWSSSYMFGIPSMSSFILSKHDKCLQSTFSFHASYVFSASVLYNYSYDLGDNTIQTCRRPDVLKTWFLWKSKGFKGLESHIDYIYDMTKEFVSLITSATDGGKSKFTLLAANPESPTVSFNYIPKSMRNMDASSEEFQNKLSKFTDELKLQLRHNGVLELSVSSLPNKPKFKFFTISLTNSVLVKSDLAYILERIEAYGDLIMPTEMAELIKASPPKSNVQGPQVTFPTFVSSPIEKLHKQFFVYAFQHLIKTGLFFEKKRKDPAKRFRSPEQLAMIIDLKFQPEPSTDNDLLAQLEKIVQYSAHQGHPFWVYQLFTGLNPYTVIGDYIVSILNTGMESYESAPAFTLTENEILHGVRALINYPNNGEGDGVINPGGTLSNIVAITLARYKKIPEVKENGISVASLGKKLVLYINIDGHYSFNKGSFLLGIGLENCILVKADELGRMSIPALREEIAKTLADGNIPFMVAATAGTTVLGAIDPLKEVAAVCKEHGMWFHVDGVFGGALIFSKTGRERLAGIELSDSLTFNPHKMFGAAMTCSVFVTRHVGIIHDAMGIIDKKAAGFSEHDRGDNHILGQRRANGFKFWLLWKAQGIKGLGQHIDYVMETTRYAMSLMNARNDSFHMILPTFDVTNLCFLYIPIQYRLMDRTTPMFKKSLDPIASQIQMSLVKDGVMDIVVQKTASMDTPTFMKFVLMSSTTNKEDVKYLMDQIDFYGKNL